MFWKKDKSTPTWADRESLRLKNEYFDAVKLLQYEAKNVIVKAGVENLYPEGPDKEAAKQETEKARKLLLCRIGKFDGIRSDYIRLRKEHADEFVTTCYFTTNLRSSHDCIEDAWRDFYGG